MPGLVWETTHVGGHRFAPNVVTLPDGSYHGGIMAADTEKLADAVLDGRVVLALFRGRAGLPAPVQAADYYVRMRCGVDRLDGVVPLGHDRVADDGMMRVELEVDGGALYDVSVRPRKLAEVRPTSCGGSGTSAAPTTFDLAAISRTGRFAQAGG